MGTKWRGGAIDGLKEWRSATGEDLRCIFLNVKNRRNVLTSYMWLFISVILRSRLAISRSVFDERRVHNHPL